MVRVKLTIFGFLLIGLTQALLAQEDIFKDYAEHHYTEKYCLYPSTMRMLNLNQDEAFDEIASSFEKLLFYEIDSISVLDQSYRQMLINFRTSGFDEYISINGSGNHTIILGKEKRVNEMVGVITLSDQTFSVFLRGNVAWQKIPTLISSLEQNELFKLLDLSE